MTRHVIIMLTVCKNLLLAGYSSIFWKKQNTDKLCQDKLSSQPIFCFYQIKVKSPCAGIGLLLGTKSLITVASALPKSAVALGPDWDAEMRSSS